MIDKNKNFFKSMFFKSKVKYIRTALYTMLKSLIFKMIQSKIMHYQSDHCCSVSQVNRLHISFRLNHLPISTKKALCKDHEFCFIS